MTACEFLAEFEQSRGVTLAERDGKLWVLGTTDVSAHDQRVLRSYREELLAALRGEDCELMPVLTTDRYLAVGLVRVERVWTHPLGDHVAERLLVGLTDFAVAEAETQAAFNHSLRREP